MAVLGRQVAAKDQVMLVGSGVGVPELAATIYGPVPGDSWVTAFGGRVGTRGTPGQNLTIGAYTVDANLLPDQWLGEAAFTLNLDLDSQIGGDPWTPAHVPVDLAVWLDANDAALVRADGATVGLWPDLSGHGRDAAEGTATEQPTYQTNELGGLPIVRFDGTDDVLETPTFPLSQPYTVVSLARDLSITDGDAYWSKTTHILRQNTGSPDGPEFVVAGQGSIAYGEFSIADLGWHISLMNVNEASTSLRWDGVASTTAGSLTTDPSAGGFRLGVSNTNAYANIDVAEVLVFDGQLATEDMHRLEGYLAHKWGLTANLPASHPYKTEGPASVDGTVRLRQTVSGTGLPNQGIPLPVGSHVAIYCFSTDAIEVSYHDDSTYTTYARDDLAALPDPFGAAEVLAGRALDLYLETAPNNAVPVVNARTLADELSNGSHILTPFFNPSGHVAVWGGEPAVNHSRFDLVDEQHGDEISLVELEVATAPDVGAKVYERTLTKGELYPILQAEGSPAYDRIAPYIGPKLPPGVYYVRARFADYFGAFSDWTPWLDRGGQDALATWIDSRQFFLSINPASAPLERIETTTPATFEAIYGADSTVTCTHAHLLVAEVESGVLERVALSEVVQAVAHPGAALVVPWDAGWPALQAGTEYGHRLRALYQNTWSPASLPEEDLALWLDADAFRDLVDGQPVASWPAINDPGLAPAQAVAANQPTYILSGQHGRSVVRFDGGDWLTLASTLGIAAQPFSQFAVWKPNGAGQRLMIWANSNGMLTTDFENDVGIFSGSALFNFDQHAFGQWHIVAGVHNGASSSLTVDGGSPATGGAGSGAPGGDLTIGAGPAGVSSWLDGDVGEVIVTRTAPDTATRQLIEGYLAHKWGLAGNLPIDHPYKAAPPDPVGAEGQRWYVSNAPEWTRFRINAVPTVPTDLSPDGASGVADPPLLVAIASDADDTPATGFGVRFRLTRPDTSQVTVNAQLRAGTVDTWEYQTTSAEVPALGSYTWDAQAFDSASETASSAAATFVHGDLPIVTITEPDPLDVISSDPLNATWTSSASQTAYQVTLTDPVSGLLVYDSGQIASAALLHPVPTSGLLHDHDYLLTIASTNPEGLVGSATVTFTMLFSLPAAPTVLTATPTALPGDIEETVVTLAWDQSAEPAFVAYRVTRQTAQQGDDGTAETTLATINDIGTVTFVDRFPASDIPYTYRVYTVAERGASDDVASLPASDTATISLTTIILTGVGFGTDLRVALRYQEQSDVEHTTDETLLIPWGDAKPTSYEGTTNYRTISATFALVFAAGEAPLDGLTVLRQLNGSLPGAASRPLICYRDDRGRKLFGTMRLREQDREISSYGASLVITETNYQEGS